MRAYERLMKYVTIHTTSDEHVDDVPSTKCQFELARELVGEMLSLGITDARMDEHAYVYGSIPASPGYEDRPCLGLIAHMDTSPDASGENVKPMIWENYDGTDIALENGRTISVSQ